MAWISTTTLLARANFADAITSARGGPITKGVGPGIDLNALLQGITATTAADLVDQLAERLGPVPINDGSRSRPPSSANRSRWRSLCDKGSPERPPGGSPFPSSLAITARW